MICYVTITIEVRQEVSIGGGCVCLEAMRLLARVAHKRGTAPLCLTLRDFSRLSASIAQAISEFCGVDLILACKMIMARHCLHGVRKSGKFRLGQGGLDIICTTPPLGNHSIFSILFASKNNSFAARTKSLDYFSTRLSLLQCLACYAGHIVAQHPNATLLPYLIRTSLSALPKVRPNSYASA